MSNNNNQNNDIGIAFALVGGVAVIFFAVVVAILAFVSLILTGIALAAWNKPVKIGKFEMQPEEARAFIHRGLAGMVILPLFVVFAAALFQVQIIDSAWGYIIFGGYVGGSLGVEIWKAQQQEADAQAAMFVMPPQIPPAREPSPPPRQPQEPFHYASWDDDEERG